MLAGYRQAPGYSMTDKQQSLAADRMGDLIDAARAWRQALVANPNRSLRRGAPNPRPAFRIVPAAGDHDD